ncbi:hypothetical protein GIB67_009851 [Kingdonia uniflora]|uniref:YTH domain-containing family protein n=1 Tax=Kingdonia uniflora TaxID=39325 RepID=A0A7J7LMW9_9MAGN|nr:hypothetical protein GIB67_009851 [Kingdonia uniflora]
MAAPHQEPDRFVSTDLSVQFELLFWIDSPNTNTTTTTTTLEEEDAQDKSTNLEQQPILSKDRIDPSKSSQNAMPMGDVTVHPGDQNAVYTAQNLFTPHPQTVYFNWSPTGGFENTSGDWSDYPQYISTDEHAPNAVFNENQSLLFHGYGYSPQISYGPYSPGTTPVPSVGGDVQMYSPQQYQFSGAPYYQQAGVQYITPPTPISQTEPSRSVRTDHQGDASLFGPRPSYSPNLGSSRKGGNNAGNSGSSSYYDSRQGFDGFGSGGSWSDWSKSLDGQRPFTPLSPAASPQPVNTLGSFGRNIGMASQQQRPSYGFGSGSSSYTRGYQHNGIYQTSSFGRAPVSSFGMNDRWLAIDKARRRGRDASSLCSCNGTLDILSEQNRGPRASKPKTQVTTEHTSSAENSKSVTITADSRNELYNRSDFVIDHKDSKFFIIKSYSEDNVHKSIKYGVWASTPNGNKKLDAAYREANEKQEACPVFLLFSVNASAQFCGVAEMVGPVDFDKSVDYWQQDKWSGQFSVKWHIVKDVPNSHFRHIILENNDNKPVTNSRDTQEVKLDQGLEMLKIFKNYESDTSILDDFEYYEDRQKVMQDRKARQQASLVSAAPATGVNDPRIQVTVPNNIIKQMSKSFAEAVRLEENSSSKEDVITEKVGGEQKS